MNKYFFFLFIFWFLSVIYIFYVIQIIDSLEDEQYIRDEYMLLCVDWDLVPMFSYDLYRSYRLGLVDFGDSVYWVGCCRNKISGDLVC